MFGHSLSGVVLLRVILLIKIDSPLAGNNYVPIVHFFFFFKLKMDFFHTSDFDCFPLPQFLPDTSHILTNPNPHLFFSCLETNRHLKNNKCPPPPF